jgi:hypothetical protein
MGYTLHHETLSRTGPYTLTNRLPQQRAVIYPWHDRISEGHSRELMRRDRAARRDCHRASKHGRLCAVITTTVVELGFHLQTLPLQQVKDPWYELRKGKTNHRIAEEARSHVHVPGHAFRIDWDAQLALLL